MNRMNTALLMVALGTSAMFSSACRTSDAGLEAHEQSEAFDLDLAIELTRLNLYVYQRLTDYYDEVEFIPPEGYEVVEDLITYQWFSGDHDSVGDDPTPIILILSKGEDLYVMFRGSVTPSEWLDDATFAQRKFDELPGDVWAHDGMSDTYRSVSEDMLKVVEDWLVEHDQAEVYISGHSLGASMGTLGAVHMVEALGIQPIIYTIASPRVGDDQFRDAYHARVKTSWRITNINDYVPRAPPSRSAFTWRDGYEIRNYRHVQALHEITFGEWVEAPNLSDTGIGGLDWNPLTSEDRDELDISAVDWDSPTLIHNHGSCSYYNYLCDQSDDPEGCKERADDQDGCNEKEDEE